MFINLIGFIFFHTIFCFLVFYYGVYILKEISLLVYIQLKASKRLDSQWILYIVHYLMVNHVVLIFMSLFAGLASVMLFFFFFHLFFKYSNNMTINEEFKFEDFDYEVKFQTSKIIKLATQEQNSI